MMDLSYFPSVFPLPITAKSWVILDGNTGYILNSCNENERREIASLTKIMTAYTSIKLIERFSIDIHKTKVEVSFDAASMGGTTANLSDGDSLSLYDMFHAMLLPSGNDAAYALAEYFGYILLESRIKGDYSCIDPAQVFVYEMNKNAKALKLTKTAFANPHGLKNYFNKSTAIDVARLASAAMKLPLFTEIVKKQKYECVGENMFGSLKDFVWANTNKLLSKGFNGVKTGITDSAGPCLVASYEDEKVSLIMVLLSSRTTEDRWEEIMKMRNWSLEQLKDKAEKRKAMMYQKRNLITNGCGKYSKLLH